MRRVDRTKAIKYGYKTKQDTEQVGEGTPYNTSSMGRLSPA